MHLVRVPLHILAEVATGAEVISNCSDGPDNRRADNEHAQHGLEHDVGTEGPTWAEMRWLQKFCSASALARGSRTLDKFGSKVTATA